MNTPDSPKTPEEKYADFVQALAAECMCVGVDRPCDGLLAGGPCDDFHDGWSGHDEDDE